MTEGPLAIGSVIAEAQTLLMRVLGSTVALQIDTPATTWPVQATADELWQIVLNLTVNARDAMPQGGSLALRTRNTAVAAGAPLGLPPGDYVVLSVQDSGSGIDAETQALIFQPFFSTKGSRGTGLGLATIARITAARGGVVRVESTPGQGTTFAIYLPRART